MGASVGLRVSFDVVMFVIVCSVCSPVNASEEASDLRTMEIFARQKAHLEAIHSVEFSSRQVMSLSEWGKRELQAPVREMEHKLTFTAKSAKYRSHVRFMDWQTRADSSVVMAYDGERYQVFNEGNRFLSVSKHPQMANAYFGLNPLIVPYMFACEPSIGDLSLTSLAAADVWSKLSDNATWAGVEEMEGRTCDVIEIQRTRGGQTILYKVYFARELDSFPVRTLMLDADGHTMFDARVREFISRAGCLIPMTVTIEGFLPASGERWQNIEIAIDEQTLHVNEPVRDEVFTIPPSEAAYYVNIDSDAQTTMRMDEWGAASIDLDKLMGEPEAESVTTEGRSPGNSVVPPKLSSDEPADTSRVVSGRRNPYLLCTAGLLIVLIGITWYILSSRRRKRASGDTRP